MRIQTSPNYKLDPQNTLTDLELRRTLQRAALVISQNTSYACYVKGDQLYVQGVRISIVHDCFTTPFSAPQAVREILKELNEF